MWKENNILYYNSNSCLIFESFLKCVKVLKIVELLIGVIVNICFRLIKKYRF